MQWLFVDLKDTGRVAARVAFHLAHGEVAACAPLERGL
jgi:hypothetical protein